MAENNTQKITFVVSDESVNKYGYRVLTEGIDTTEFEKNPVMFFNHHRSDWQDEERLPIGKWSNFRIDENNRLLMDAELDMNDEFAQKIHSKVENGVLNAASIGIAVVELSDDQDTMLPGQFRSTITKAILQEVSIVDIPANSNAMRLNHKGATLTLNDKTDFQELNNVLPILTFGQTLGSNLMRLIEEYAEENEITIGEAQEAAGNAAGISADTVANIVNGDINCPPLERIEGFAEFFNVPMSSFMTWAESDGCEYTEEENEQQSTSIGDMINNAISSFFETLTASFNITPKDSTNPDDDQKELNDVTESLRAEIAAIEIPVDESLKSDVNQVNESIKQIELMFEGLKTEITSLKEENNQLKEELLNLKANSKQLKPDGDNGVLGSTIQPDNTMKQQFSDFGKLGLNLLKKQ